MGVKHVTKYYKDIEKMYFDLIDNLKEMEGDFKAGECTEEELNNLLMPVKSIEENYKLLSYFMYLLYQPNRDKKEDRYNKSNKEMYEYFKDNKLLKEQTIEKNKYALDEFKKNIKEKKYGRKEGN